MKKSFTKALLLAFLSGASLHGANCNDPQTTLEMKECESMRLQRADKELNAVYKKLIARKDNIGKEKLKKAQRAWMALRDADAEFFSDSFRGGTMEGLTYIGVQASMTENRIKELKDELNN